MARPSQKRGISGQANALSQPYRKCGGTHDHPRFHQPYMNMARVVQPSDFRLTATYATGVQGGILAKLALKKELSPDENRLIGRTA